MKPPPAPQRPQRPERRAPVDPLEQLAAAYGVATTYEDWARRRVPVAAETVRTVLGLLGVDAEDPAAALVAYERRLQQRGLPPTIVLDHGKIPEPVPAVLAEGAEPVAVVELEDGGTRTVEVTRTGQ